MPELIVLTTLLSYLKLLFHGMHFTLGSYLKIKRGFVHAILLYLIGHCIGNTAHAKWEHKFADEAYLGDFQFAGGL